MLSCASYSRNHKQGPEQMQKIDSIEKLEAAYSAPVGERSIWKEIDHVNELYRKFIEASPFLILATCGDNGVDCSPRGDPPAA